MPFIASVSTATPPFLIEQRQAKDFARKVFGESRDIERLMPVFDNANIDRRFFSRSIEWLATPHDFTEANDAYIEVALDLTEEVVCRATELSGARTQDLDAIFFVSTTGLSTPSIDARLFNRIPLSRHIKRIPIWGLGCAGGAAGIARASEYLRACPEHRVVVVALELCSLAFQRNEVTKSNIIATALFGDGAAACVMFGDNCPLPHNGIAHPSIVGSLSTIYENSLEVMGWRVTDEGFKVVLSRDIPSIVTNLVDTNIHELLDAHDISLNQVKHYVAHPGGTKVLQAICDGLGIPKEALDHSRNVLREFGNMSSATVYFILERFLRESADAHEEYGLLSALGPGFSSELVLLKWD